MIGHVIGNYKIQKKLGEGGMGAVYMGIDMMLEREVAIKALRPELGSQPQVVERFRSEAVTLAKLNHPNIATLYSFFRQGDDFFMVLEFVRGETLDHIIGQGGALSCERAIPLFCQVLDGIDHAHRYGIVHRDIKPANMMLTDMGTLKVLDFGIARILGTARMTKAGHLIGTIEYMAPEQVRGQETDARSDIYALGILLYEMLTGHVPFASENEYELMKAQIEDQPLPPRQLNPDIPDEVEQAIMRAIAKNPDDRFQTAGEFRAVLLGAGFVSTGALNPGAAGVSPYATTRLSNPQFQAPTTPPVSRPSLTTPPASHEAGPETITEAGGGGASAKQPTGGAAFPGPIDQIKETRLGVGGSGAMSAAAAPTNQQLKETRLGAPHGALPTAADAYQQPQYVAAPGQTIPGQATFFSRLTPVHYIGAGVAAMVLIAVAVVLPLLLLAGGGTTPNKNEQTQSPVAAQPAASAVAEPAVVPQQPASLPVTTDQGIDPALTGATAAGTTTPVTSSKQDLGGESAPSQIITTDDDGLNSAPAGARGRTAGRPAPRTPPKTDAAAAAAARERARRRAEALRLAEQ